MLSSPRNSLFFVVKGYWLPVLATVFISHTPGPIFHARYLSRRNCACAKTVGVEDAGRARAFRTPIVLCWYSPCGCRANELRQPRQGIVQGVWYTHCSVRCSRVLTRTTVILRLRSDNVQAASSIELQRWLLISIFVNMMKTKGKQSSYLVRTCRTANVIPPYMRTSK